MTCALCFREVTLFELADWQGLPAHESCARGAQDALDEAIERIAAENRKSMHRTSRRYGRVPS